MLFVLHCRNKFQYLHYNTVEALDGRERKNKIKFEKEKISIRVNMLRKIFLHWTKINESTNKTKPEENNKQNTIVFLKYKGDADLRY